MSAKRVQAVKSRKVFYIKLVSCLLIVLALAFVLKQKKDALVREGTNFLQQLVSREAKLDIKVGKISGRLFGSVRFDDVRLEDPVLPAGLRLLLRAKRVEIRYHLLDLLTKNYASKITLIVTEPELYWQTRVGLKRDRFGFFGWLKEWGLAQRKHLHVIVKDLKITQRIEGREFGGIQIEYRDDAFQVRAPVRHLDFWGHDVSTELVVKGRFETGVLNTPDSLAGEIFTAGSVINWSPLPWESRFDFTWNQDALKIWSTDFLGGFDVAAELNFQKNDEINLSLKTEGYRLSNFGPFVHTGTKAPVEGSLDLEALFKGRLESPDLEAYATITGGRSGPNKYKSLILHVKGVYPSLRLSDSRILFDDGKVMRFTDQNIEIGDLFSESNYKHLASGSDQETVVLGKWELRRPDDLNEAHEFTLQRAFGEHATLQVKKANAADEVRLDSPEKDDMEVGFQYRLQGKDTLKFEVREDERFVGVERRMSF